MIDGIPLPARDGPFETGFWDALDRGELVHQHCASCGQWHFPPRWRCTCSGALAFQPVSGGARLWSWTVVHPPVLTAFAASAPYVVGIAQLDEAENLRMVGPIIIEDGDPPGRVRPADLRIGMKLTATIARIAQDIAWPSWKIL